MADQTFNVNCGFFDSVNSDRLYTADDMNKPYNRLVANGVFATPQGTPSTDLQVVSAGNGMRIIAKEGQGIFANKWFENPSAITIVVPSNTDTVPRRDSVIVQVDTREAGRVGNIVYRTGTPASNPQPPDIGTVTGVEEYRIANIYVAASAQNINNDAIVDLRGSSECPWVTALIQQVDTSQLFNQWQAAYQAYYDSATSEYENYVSEQQQAWEAFVSQLTEELTVSTNVIMLSSNYIAQTAVSNIPINIPSFNPETDILQVFINGLIAVQGQKYTLNSNNTSIDLTAQLAAGQSVTFIVFKSVIGGDIESAVTMIRKLDDKVANFMADSGWITFSLESGATAYDSTTKPAVRCIGNRVYLRGAFKGITASGSTICTLPVDYRPAQDHVYLTSAIGGSTVDDTVAIKVSATDGTIKMFAISGTISATDMISIATTFLANKGVSVAMVYVYMGSVSTYANLPTSGMNIGDVYMIEQADSTHNIAAGDDVMWNGTDWELLNSVISSSEIDAIIDTIS